jgi:hypothetical protein
MTVQGLLLGWQGCEALEGPRRSQRTRDQLERFRAVVAWRLGSRP